MKHSDTYVRLIDRLRTLRHARGYTQAALADKLGLSRSQYTAIEGGTSKLLLENLFSLASIYRVRLVDLMEGIDDMARPKGSKVIKCPKCDRRVVGKPGAVYVCKNPKCGTQVTIPR